MAQTFCPNCGNPIPDGAVSCPNCGAPRSDQTQLSSPIPPYAASNPPAQRPQGRNNSVLYVLIGVLCGMLAVIAGVLGYRYFTADKTQPAVSDSAVVITDTVYQSPGAVPASQPSAPSMTLLSGGEYNYSGTIAGQRVSVTLNNMGGSVSGSYRYTKFTNDNRLVLTGTLNGNQLEVYEINESGQYTGFIAATVTATGISGKFTNLSSGKRYNVNLLQQ